MEVRHSVELFQILKDDAVKVLQFNMPGNLENSAVATELEKVSFHSNPKERQCQRNAALGMVVVALIQLMPAAIKNKWAMLAAVVAFVLIAVLRVNTAYVILLFAVLGITVTFAGSRKMAAAAEGSAGAENVDALAEGNAAGGKTGGGKDGAQTIGAVSDGGAENAEAGEGGESE